MFQELPSSQLSFQTAAEDQDAPWDDDLHNYEDYENDLDLVEELSGPEPFENLSHMSEWTSAFPPDLFRSYGDVIEQMNKFIGLRGYAVFVKNSKRRKGDDLLYRAYVKCDRGGERKVNINEFKRVRETSTRMCECEWKGVLYKVSEYVWTFQMKNDVPHNHDLSFTEMTHPFLRRVAIRKLGAIFVDVLIK